MSHTSECDKLLSEISNLIDGSIAPELCVELEAHLRECRNCRIVVDTTRRTIELYHQDEKRLEMPASAREKLWKCLNLDDFADKSEEM